MKQTNEAAFETVIETHLLSNGYVVVDRDAFDRERAVFSDVVLEFIRETQAKEWAKLEALHGAKTGEQVLSDLSKWMDLNGSLATLRHGFKCYGRTLRVTPPSALRSPRRFAQSIQAKAGRLAVQQFQGMSASIGGYPAVQRLRDTGKRLSPWFWVYSQPLVSFLESPGHRRTARDDTHCCHCER